MTIVRWDPFKELEEMNDRLNRVFGRGQFQPNNKEMIATPDWAPMVDISETVEEFVIKAELPEVKKEDVKVSVEGGVLRFEGERKQEREEKGKKFHRVERSYGRFMRSFALPDSIDEAAVKAEYKDGVLNIHLPKVAKAKPKSVEVKVS